MSGPISIATISGDGAPQHTEFKLTLTLSLRSYEPFPAESIANHMTRVLGNYSDGRHPLDAELIVVSLERIMQTALYQCCVEECVSQFGREMVVLSPGHQHSRAYLEADKLFTERKKSLPCLLEEGVITITPQEENYE